MLIRSIVTTMLIFLSFASWTQKNKQTQGIPSISENYEYCSIFKFENEEYILKESFDVLTPTFLKTNPKTNEIYLPGIGNQQTCFYTPDLCSFIKKSDITQSISLPIECLAVGGESEKRNLQIHYILEKRKTEYIFSLDVPGTPDRILFHNFNGKKLGELITNKDILFQ